MLRRIGNVALVAGALLALGLLVAACGDDDNDGGGNGGEELSLEDYFQRVEALAVAFDESAEELDGQFDRLESASGDDAVTLTRDILSGTAESVRTLADGLADLNAPAEAAEAHDAAVSSGTELADALDEAAAEADAAETEDEAADALLSFVDVAAGDEFSDSCVQLQLVADDNGIEVDLRCG